MDELISSLKSQIIEQLKLDDVSPDDINADDPLFNDGLGLDSIDALELIVLVEKSFGIKISSAEEGQTAFKSIRSMAEYITANKKDA